MSKKKVFYSIILTANCKIKLVGTDESELIFDELDSANGDFHFHSNNGSNKVIPKDCIVGDLSVAEWIELQCTCKTDLSNPEPIEPEKTVEDFETICVPLVDGSAEVEIIRKLCSDGTYVYDDMSGAPIADITIYDLSQAQSSNAKLVEELCAALVQDFCAFGADRVLTKQEIIDFAVSKGLTYSDGTPVTSSAVIHKINIGIKLHDVPASDDMTGDFTTTNCEVDITSDGGTVTKTGGGNHTYTGQVVGEDLKESSFEEIIIKEGSCVEISASIIEVS